MFTPQIKIILSSAFIFFLAFGCVSLSDRAWAQEPASDSQLIHMLERLVTQLDKITTGPTQIGQSAALQQTTNIVGVFPYISGPRENEHCVDDYLSWPTSTTRKDAPWSLNNIPGSYRHLHMGNGYYKEEDESAIRQFLDINGDSLVDFIYHYSKPMAYGGVNNNSSASCTMLNNGSGWDIVYQCVFKDGSYYGDCADIQ